MELRGSTRSILRKPQADYFDTGYGLSMFNKKLDKLVSHIEQEIVRGRHGCRFFHGWT